MSGDPDALFTLRTNFWLGLYELAIAEGEGLLRGIPDSLRTERDEFMYRSYIALGKADKVLAEVGDDAPVSLQAVKLLAMYEANADMRETVMVNLSQWMLDPSSANNTTLQLVAAMLHCREGNLAEAVSCVRNGVTMEQIAMLAQIYIMLDRPDLAKRQHDTMVAADEDHTLCQLAGAWINVAEGGAKKCREASLLYGELIDKHQPSPMLLNGQAVSRMHLGEYEDAYACLTEALELGADADTLINLVACCRHLDKPEEEISAHLSKLSAQFPDHLHVKSISKSQGAFSRVCAQYTAAC